MRDASFGREQVPLENPSGIDASELARLADWMEYLSDGSAVNGKIINWFVGRNRYVVIEGGLREHAHNSFSIGCCKRFSLEKGTSLVGHDLCVKAGNVQNMILGDRSESCNIGNHGKNLQD
jgi:hypothetical protein